MTDHNHTPARPVGDTDVHELVGSDIPAAVLVYAPNRVAAGHGYPDSDGYALMWEHAARADGYPILARAEDILARFGPAPLEDDEAHDAADAINAGTL